MVASPGTSTPCLLRASYGLPPQAVSQSSPDDAEGPGTELCLHCIYRQHNNAMFRETVLNVCSYPGPCYSHMVGIRRA